MYYKQLDNYVNYNDHKVIENLLRNYNNLKELSELGYPQATDICIDLEKALNQIDEKNKYCLVEHFIEGNTRKEVAELLQITENGVTKRISKGLNDLFEILSDLEEEE